MAGSTEGRCQWVCSGPIRIDVCVYGMLDWVGSEQLAARGKRGVGAQNWQAFPIHCGSAQTKAELIRLLFFQFSHRHDPVRP
jgi:hypothetical protein